jgi:excinuclease UvrABC ATPase subunit
MSEEKPKYVRKKCEHNRYKFQCKDCNGSQNNKSITSCWGINKLGICALKKTKVKEWDNRLEILKNQIEYWCNSENKTEKTIEIIQLFYDEK